MTLEDTRAALAQDTVELVDRLYHARLLPTFSTDATSTSSCFPGAERLLTGDGSDIFRRIQASLGLLQTVILFGLPTQDDPRNSHRLEHVQTVLRLTVPWLTVDSPESWQQNPAARSSTLDEAFRQYREDPGHGVQEFVGILATRDRVTAFERQNNYLLVPDGEQSFFSLLWVLLEAGQDAATLDDLLGWLRTSSSLLRSVLCHEGIDGDSTTNARRLPAPWQDHYWRFDAIGN